MSCTVASEWMSQLFFSHTNCHYIIFMWLFKIHTDEVIRKRETRMLEGWAKIREYEHYRTQYGM